MYGKSSTPLFYMISKKSGNSPKTYMEVRKESMGKYGTWFTGLVATLVYDIGYMFTFIFSLIYFYFIRMLSPRKGIISIKKFIWTAIMIPIPLMFFANNHLSYLSYSIAIIYALLFSFFLSLKRIG
jgi:hypothetical protein